MLHEWPDFTDPQAVRNLYHRNGFSRIKQKYDINVKYLNREFYRYLKHYFRGLKQEAR